MLIFRCFVSNPTLNPVTFGFGGRKPNPQTSRQNQTVESHDPEYVAKNRKPALGSQETKWRYEAIKTTTYYILTAGDQKKNLQNPGSPHHLSLTGVFIYQDSRTVRCLAPYHPLRLRGSSYPSLISLISAVQTQGQSCFHRERNTTRILSRAPQDVMSWSRCGKTPWIKLRHVKSPFETPRCCQCCLKKKVQILKSAQISCL